MRCRYYFNEVADQMHDTLLHDGIVDTLVLVGETTRADRRCSFHRSMNEEK
jgi:hypothetical protein